MKPPTRQVFLKYYWLLALLFGGLACGVALQFGGPERVALAGASVAGALGFCYFAQQQKLAETTLFHQLFTEFNARYRELNGALAQLVGRPVGSLEPAERDTIVDYFNLCGEEYLFFSEGYIHRNAWRSWCRGMSWYLRRHPFADVWQEEAETDSLYGLTRAEIDSGVA
jgi:hypothetical protein